MDDRSDFPRDSLEREGADISVLNGLVHLAESTVVTHNVRVSTRSIRVVVSGMVRRASVLGLCKRVSHASRESSSRLV